MTSGNDFSSRCQAFPDFCRAGARQVPNPPYTAVYAYYKGTLIDHAHETDRKTEAGELCTDFIVCKKPVPPLASQLGLELGTLLQSLSVPLKLWGIAGPCSVWLFPIALWQILAPVSWRRVSFSLTRGLQLCSEPSGFRLQLLEGVRAQKPGASPSCLQCPQEQQQQR